MRLAIVMALLLLTAAACADSSEEVLPDGHSSQTPIASVQPTATPVPPAETPVNGGLAPDGCSSSELAYIDPDNRFAVCYRSDMNVRTVRDPTASGTSVTLQYPLTDLNRASVAIGWEQTPSYIPCVESLDVIKNQHMEKIVVSRMIIDACVEDHYDVSHPDVYLSTTIDFAIPRKGGDPILVEAGYTGENVTRSGLSARAVTNRILSSIKVN
jgi:hypothetical protein